MSLFQIISIIGIGGALAAIPVHYLLIARRAPHPGLGMRGVKRYNLWERLVHLALLMSFLVLAVTGFVASIGWNGPMKGYMLMLHTTSGAVFAVSVGCMLVTWAADHAFTQADGRWFRGGGCCTPVKELPAGRFTGGEKVYFWLAGLLTLAALVSMLMSMVPVLGTEGQALMYHVHRWSTLVLVVATIWHAYATTLAKPGGLAAILAGHVSEAWLKRFHPLWGTEASQPQARAD
jgi:formate dehydrogenase subunit gamma